MGLEQPILYQSGRNINGEVPATYNSGDTTSDTNGYVGEEPEYINH